MFPEILLKYIDIIKCLNNVDRINCVCASGLIFAIPMWMLFTHVYTDCSTIIILPRIQSVLCSKQIKFIIKCRHILEYMLWPHSRDFRKSFMYSGAAIWNSLPLLVKNATSVNTFKYLYLKWKRLNGHWIISITTANLILYFVLI